MGIFREQSTSLFINLYQVLFSDRVAVLPMAAQPEGVLRITGMGCLICIGHAAQAGTRAAFCVEQDLHSSASSMAQS